MYIAFWFIIYPILWLVYSCKYYVIDKWDADKTIAASLVWPAMLLLSIVKFLFSGFRKLLSHCE